MPKTFLLKGIRGRLLLLLVIVLVSVLLVEAFIYHRRFETQKSEELQANLEMARAVARSFDTFIQDLVRGELVIGLALTASQPITERDRDRILDEFQADHPAVRSVFWMNDQGLVIASSLRSYVGFNLSDRSFFQKVKEGRKWTVSELIIGRATDKPGFTVSRGIRNEEGKLVGVVAASVEPDRLDSVLGIERLKDAGVSLVDNKGMHVYRYPATEYTWEQRNWLKHYPTIENSLKGKDVFASVISERTGEKRLVAFTPISSIGWVATAGRSEDVVMKAITTTLLFQAGLVFLVTLVGFGAAVALARPISNSIIRLRNQTLALGRGEMGNLVPVSGPEELEDLAVSFNQMASEVRSREVALRGSEQRWVTTLASIGDAVIATDLSGKITFMNKIAEELTGWTLSEASTKPVAEVFYIINEHSRNRVEDPVAKVLKEGVIVGLANHTVLVGKSGREIPIDDSGAPIRDQDGRIMGVVLIFRDITERKRAEEATSRSQKTFLELVERSPFGTYVVDSQFRIAMMNAASQDGAFRNARPVIGRDFNEAMRILWPEPVAAEITAHFRHTLESGEPYYSPRFINPRHDVEIVESYEWELHRMTLPDGQYGVICYYYDSTKLREAEAARLQSEERFRVAQELSPDGFSILRPVRDSEGRVVDFTWVYANAATERSVGMKLPVLAGRSLLELFPGHRESPILKAYRQAAETGQTHVLESFYQGDGVLTQRWFRIAVVSMGQDIAVLSQDITERKQVEESLKRQAQLLQLSYDAIIVWPMDGGIEQWNRGAEKLYGFTESEALSHVTHDLLRTIHPMPWQEIKAIMRKYGQWEGELRHSTKEGREVIVSARLQIVHGADGIERVLETNRDITERKHTEEALRKAYERTAWLAGFPDQNPNPIIRVSADGKVLYCNPATAKHEGWKCEVGRALQNEFFPLVGRAMTEGTETQHDMEFNGRFYIVWVAPFSGEGYANLYGRDITDRKQAEQDLLHRTLELQHLTETLEERVKERTTELANLSSELLVAQEKERKRISYNLHDNVWQTLEIIRTQLDHLFSAEDEADWPAYHRKAKQLIPVIRDTISRVRSMQGDLWPSVLDDIGIVATLEWYCREFGKNNPSLGIEKNVGLAEEEVPASAKIIIYRVMQEALSNVAKHSQASQVSLSLIKSDHSLEFIIRDNGIGFDPEEAIARKSPWGGLGLRSMKERTEFSGGLFGVESAKGQGTTVRASWPLSGNN